MYLTGESLAWLARRDGGIVIGHGPFESSATPQVAGVAFHVGDFPLKDPQPWKISSRVDRGRREIFASRFAETEQLQCRWQALVAVPFAVVC